MAFLNAQIKKVEITKNSSQEIIKIYIVAELQDDSLVESKVFDYVIDGGSLDEIKDNFKEGVIGKIKQEARRKYNEWIQNVQKSIEIKNELTPLQIKSQLGFNQIDTLD